jgi:hypothetical protein
MPFGLLTTGPAQHHPLVQDDLVPHLRRLADDHAHPVVNEDPSPNARAGVNLHPRQRPIQVGDQTGQQVAASPPEKMGDPMKP